MKIFNYNNLLRIIINSSLIIKIGRAPFHFWFPNIIEGLSWINCLILITWQKITPLILLSYYFNLNFLFIVILINVIIGALRGLNQTSLRKLLAFSSINHLGWIIFSITIRETLLIFYILIYIFLIILLCIIFYLLNIYIINQLFFNNINNIIKFIIFINFLSLGGLPPFLGFLPKWIIINFLIQNEIFFTSFIFLITALIVIFFYIRIIYSIFIFNYLKLKWFKIKLKKNIFNFINLLSLISTIRLIFRIFFFF